jgi:DNA-binding CsgD family transcriptional regulator
VPGHSRGNHQGKAKGKGYPSLDRAEMESLLPSFATTDDEVVKPINWRPAQPNNSREPRAALRATNLTLHEIAGELYVSLHAVRTHRHHLYAKPGVHRRSDAVARARTLGILAPSSRT